MLGGGELACTARSECMDIKNILNKDAAGEERSDSDLASRNSISVPGTPKSTASAPAVPVHEAPAAGSPSPRVEVPSGISGTRTFAPGASTTRDFICTTCEKTFARRSDLVRHGAPPFLCFLTTYLQKGYTPA